MIQGKADEELGVLRRAKLQCEGTEDFHQWCAPLCLSRFGRRCNVWTDNNTHLQLSTNLSA